MPFAAAIPLISAGISAAGNALAARNQPQPNRRVPFTGAVDPSRLLGEGMTGISGLFNTLTSRLQQGTSLPGAYAQDVPGLSARDPRAPTTPGSLELQWPGMDWAPAQAAQSAATQTTSAPGGSTPSRGLPIMQSAIARAVQGLPPEAQDAYHAAQTDQAGGISAFPTTGPIRLSFGSGADPRNAATTGNRTAVPRVRAGVDAPSSLPAGLTPQQQAAIQLVLAGGRR